METKQQIAKNIPPILLKALVSTYVLYFMSQLAHWNVEGKNFVELHTFFGQVYSDAVTAVDEIAERVRALDVKIPENILENIAKAFPETESTNYVSTLLSINEKLVEQWDDIAKVADAAGDSATVDLSGKRASTHAKFGWMLRALNR